MTDTIAPDIQPITTPDNTTPDGAVTGNGLMAQYALREYFDVWRPTNKESDAMNYILEVAKARNLVSKGDIFKMLREVELKTGINELPRLTRITNYIRVDNQINELMKLKQAYAR